MRDVKVILHRWQQGGENDARREVEEEDEGDEQDRACLLPERFVTRGYEFSSFWIIDS